MQILNILHVLVAIGMVAFILVQRGPGATAGAAFGSGASGTVFGSRGAGSFLSRSTWVLATAFCLISLGMAVMVSRQLADQAPDLGIMGASPGVTEQAAPEPGLQSLDDAGDTSDLPVLDTGADDPATDLPELDAPELPDAAEGGGEESSDGST